MSGLELNKIIAAILLGALIIMLVSFITDILYKPELNVKTRGYSVAVKELTPANTAPVELKIDIAALMKQANAAAGEITAKKCLSCHTMDNTGINKIGPNLWNIVNRKKAVEPGYSYSTALSGKGGNWDYESLLHFLHKPREFIPGTKMTFIGLEKPQDAANVIAYLREKIGDSQPALP